MAAFASRFAAALLLLAVPQAASAPHKHVVLMVLDDIGWADVGYHGSNFKTPNIDKMANGGVKLERMYTYPQCSPTRTSILTGRYAHKQGMQHFTTLIPGGKAGMLKEDGTATVAETFKAAGYSTRMVGKWHTGYSSWSQTPTGRGFDSHFGYLQGECDYYNRTLFSCEEKACIYKGNRFASPLGPNGAAMDVWDGRRAAWEEFGTYSLDAYDKHLEAVFKPYGSSSPPKEPLFLYFADQTLHIPIQAPPGTEHLERCRGVEGGSGALNRTVLCAMAARMDDTVGKIQGWLEQYKMWNDTLLFAVTDNGGMTHWGEIFPASASSNWPLRGGKTTVFEGGVRGVSFVSGGALPESARGATRNQLLHAADIMPTLADFAGIKISAPTDGMSAWLAITDDHATRNELPVNIGVNPLGGLDDEGQLPPGIIGGGGLNYSAVISWPWKIIVGDPFVRWATNDDRRRDGWWGIEDYKYTPPTEDFGCGVRLYNLEEDESEHTNLAKDPKYAELVQSLVGRVEWHAKKENGYMMEQNNRPLPEGNPRNHNWTWQPFLPKQKDLEAIVV